jgi:putative spermidine/putrescine transport system ATP-binding protein
MGGQNVVTGRADKIQNGTAFVLDEAGNRFTVACNESVKEGDELRMAVRRDRIMIGDNPTAGHSSVTGTVTDLEYQGTFVKVAMSIAGHDDFIVNLPDDVFFANPLDAGQQVTANWENARNFHLLGRNDSAGNPLADGH